MFVDSRDCRFVAGAWETREVEHWGGGGLGERGDCERKVWGGEPSV